MTTTVQQFASQSQGLARIETQMDAVEERVSELRVSLYGTDGHGGIVRKIGDCETALKSIEKEIGGLKVMADEFKKTILKVVVFVIGSGALSGGAAAKLLGVFAP